MEQIKYRYYAFRLFQFSFPLYLLLLVYRAIPLVFISGTTEGEVVTNQAKRYYYTSRYGSELHEDVKTPIIEYTVNGRTYTTLGGFDSQILVGKKVKVWYWPYAPGYAVEKSFWGIVNFRYFAKSFRWFLLFTAVLFAYSNYEVFKFRLPVVNAKRFFALLGIAFVVPLLWWAPFFIHSNMISGTVTSDLVMHDLRYYRTIIGKSNQQEIRALTALEGSYYEDNQGTTIIFDTRNPTQAYEFSFYTFYSGTPLVCLVIAFVVLSAMWYISGFEPE